MRARVFPKLAALVGAIAALTILAVSLPPAPAQTQPASPAARAAGQIQGQGDAVRAAAEAAERAGRAAAAAQAAAKAAAEAAASARKAQVEAEAAAREAAAAGRLARPGGATSHAPMEPSRSGSPGASTTLRVGPQRAYRRPSEAAAVARNGDTVEIEAGSYPGDVAIWRQSDLTLRGVGGRAQLRAQGRSAEGKAIWVIKGDRVVVENIEFSDCHVPDRNGAGIRLEGTGLTIRNSVFRDNDEGILTGRNDNGDIVIESSEFANNGFGDGRSHNMYIGRARSFTLRNSAVHHAKIGHNVKVHAKSSFILYNRIYDGADGTSSYAVELPSGGSAVLIGNIIQQGPETDNSTIISYGAESGATGAALYLVNNTIVNDRPQGGLFLQRRLAGPTTLINNIFVGRGSLQGSVQTLKGNLIATGASPEAFAPGAAAADNVVATDPGFVDRAAMDYRLRTGSPAIDRGVDPGAADGQSLSPAFEFNPRVSARPRPRRGPLDIGAMEYEGR